MINARPRPGRPCETREFKATPKHWFLFGALVALMICCLWK